MILVQLLKPLVSAFSSEKAESEGREGVCGVVGEDGTRKSLRD